MSATPIPTLAPRARAVAAQLAASDPDVSAFVAASAGSGKTKLLTDRLLRLMLAGAAPEKIQCLTFTKAAAAEMSLRLQNTLAEWVRLDALALDQALTDRVEGAIRELGYFAAPDDCYLVLRGMRTMAIRLPRHWETGLTLARWFQQQPEVDRVYHPALPDDPGHAIWKRDFTGSTGLFSVGFKAIPRTGYAALIDGMKLFGMGASWGGFESLLLPGNPAPIRTATKWSAPGPLLRIHAGLEDPADLIADFDAGFGRLRAATRASAG